MNKILCIATAIALLLPATTMGQSPLKQQTATVKGTVSQQKATGTNGSQLPAAWNKYVYINSQNGKRFTKTHMISLRTGRGGDVTSITVIGDTAYMDLKPGVWERIDSIATLVNTPAGLQRK